MTEAVRIFPAVPQFRARGYQGEHRRRSAPTPISTTTLDGTCVLLIGADHPTPPAQRVREFWSEHFGVMGRDLDAGQYRLRPPRDVVEC